MPLTIIYNIRFESIKKLNLKTILLTLKKIRK